MTLYLLELTEIFVTYIGKYAGRFPPACLLAEVLASL